MLCYLHPHYDGIQPGGCPTMYFRDMTATITDVKQHTMCATQMPAAAPCDPVLPLPQRKIHTRGNIWGFTVY